MPRWRSSHAAIAALLACVCSAFHEHGLRVRDQRADDGPGVRPWVLCGSSRPERASEPSADFAEPEPAYVGSGRQEAGPVSLRSHADPRTEALLHELSAPRSGLWFLWTGQLLLDGELRDAIDVIPELERSSLQLDLLYGYFGAEGLAGGRLDLFAGRLMEVQTLDWFSMDGLKARAHLPRGIVVEAFGGLRVRESSVLGSDFMEPDGTSGALCEEYVEGAISWQWRLAAYRRLAPEAALLAHQR
jgi:hypothetical protein